MKTLKIKHLLSALAAFCFAVGVFEYAGAKDQKDDTTERSVPVIQMNQPWTFNGGANDSPLDSTKYVPGTPTGACLGTETVCQLNAPDGGDGFPDLSAEVIPHSQTVRQRIEAALEEEEPNETAYSLKN